MPRPNELTPNAILHELTAIGTPDRCIRQTRRLQDVVGISHFICSFWFGDVKQDKILRSMRQFADEVMPAFRD